MKSEKLFFENSNGVKLCAILSIPSAGCKKIVVMAHGFATNKQSNSYQKIHEKLSSAGIATLRFDFFGHGESEGKFEDITLSEAVDDVVCAIKFAKSRGFEKIGLLGGSFGGNAAFIAASKLAGKIELSFLALKSPASDFEGLEVLRMKIEGIEEWKKTGFSYYVKGNGEKLRLNYSFFEDLKQNNGYGVAGKITVPTLIVHGDKDDDVPIGQSIKLAKLIPNCTLETIAGADHRYSQKEHFEKMVTLFSNFAVSHLNG